MKQFVLLAGLLLATLSSAQVQMDVIVSGRKAGKATLSQRRNPQGYKIVNLGMVLDNAENTITIRSESTYDPKGAPIRMFQESVVAGKDHHRREVIVSFDSDGANVVLLGNGDRVLKHVSAPASPTREDASEFWFLRDTPEVGSASTAVRFNLDSLTWDTVNTVFRGVRPMTIGNHRVTANITESEQGKAFMDSNGLPLRLELTSATMERVWEKP
jgi:hypothetical protein